MRVPTGLVCALLLFTAGGASAQPAFVNGLVIAGNRLDATLQPGANRGRFGHFSDIYYDPIRNEWWALSDRGPGGGLIEYVTRLSRFDIDINPITGAISNFRVKETIKLRDLNDRLIGPTTPVPDLLGLNGLNPLLLNGAASVLGRSFDPEGLAVDPRTGRFIIADEYGPEVYEFGRTGRLVGVFQTPDNLLPKPAGALDYVAGRSGSASGSGRQDNRGYEGIAISPDGKRLYAILQDPLINEGPRGNASDLTDNDGRDGRNLRIVVFDNDWWSPTYRWSVAQYVYQLEPQQNLINRIAAAGGGTVAPGDIRQGRNIGVSAIVALNDHQFLVIERDNRGIGVDNPVGIGSGIGPPSRSAWSAASACTRSISTVRPTCRRCHSPTTAIWLPPASRRFRRTTARCSSIFAANTLLPTGNRAEKWEGLTIGPRLLTGGRLILTGNDNDYSVTQTGSGEQFDVYVDFKGNFARCVLDSSTLCEVNPPSSDLVIDNPVPLPAGYSLLPGVLHAYRASAQQMQGYVQPRHWIFTLLERLRGFHSAN